MTIVPQFKLRFPEGARCAVCDDPITDLDPVFVDVNTTSGRAVETYSHADCGDALRAFDPLRADHPLVTDAMQCGICGMAFAAADVTTLVDPVPASEDDKAAAAAGRPYTAECKPAHLACAQARARTQRAERLRVAAARRRARAQANDVLHPNGRCTCAGEGRCTWCRTIGNRIDEAYASSLPVAPLVLPEAPSDEAPPLPFEEPPQTEPPASEPASAPSWEPPASDSTTCTPDPSPSFSSDTCSYDSGSSSGGGGFE